MTNLLQQAFHQAKQLPEWEQDALAAFILEEIAASQQWNRQSAPTRKQGRPGPRQLGKMNVPDYTRFVK